MAKDDNQHQPIPAEMVCRITFREVMTSLGVARETLIEIIEEGIIEPEQNPQDEFVFDDESLRRVRTVLQLNRDLGVNIAGAGLALELMQEIERLKVLLAR